MLDIVNRVTSFRFPVINGYQLSENVPVSRGFLKREVLIII